MEDPLVAKPDTQTLESQDRTKLVSIRGENMREREYMGKGRKETMRWGEKWAGRNLFDNKYGKI